MYTLFLYGDERKSCQIFFLPLFTRKKVFDSGLTLIEIVQAILEPDDTIIFAGKYKNTFNFSRGVNLFHVSKFNGIWGAR